MNEINITSELITNGMYVLVGLLGIYAFVTPLREKGIRGLSEGLFLSITILFIGIMAIDVIPNFALHQEEYKQQAIQHNTQTVMVEGKECVIYDDGGLFSNPSIDCDWEK